MSTTPHPDGSNKPPILNESIASLAALIGGIVDGIVERKVTPHAIISVVMSLLLAAEACRRLLEREHDKVARLARRALNVLRYVLLLVILAITIFEYQKLTSALVQLRARNKQLEATAADLAEVNHRLDRKTQELQIRALIDYEPRLVGTPEEVVGRYFDANARIENILTRSAVIGLPGIAARYTGLSRSKTIYMNGDVDVTDIVGDWAYATGITYSYEPGKGMRWQRLRPEVWRLHKVNGTWLIDRFLFFLPDTQAATAELLTRLHESPK